MMGDFDAKTILETVRALRARKRHRKSKLDKYRDEIMALVNEGASANDIVIFLREYKRMKVSVSSITRYLERMKNAVEDAQKYHFDKSEESEENKESEDSVKTK
jgi:IS30 family transposase